MELTTAGKGIATVCSLCSVGAISNTLGLPENDLISGIIGAFLSLAFVKPYHWGTWFNYPPQKTVLLESLYWLRRTLLVMFILLAVAIIMTAIVHAMKLENFDSRIMSLLFSATGQASVPSLIKKFTRVTK